MTADGIKQRRSLLARVAGNVASGIMANPANTGIDIAEAAELATSIAIAILAKVVELVPFEEDAAPARPLNTMEFTSNG